MWRIGIMKRNAKSGRKVSSRYALGYLGIVEVGTPPARGEWTPKEKNDLRIANVLHRDLIEHCLEMARDESRSEYQRQDYTDLANGLTEVWLDLIMRVRPMDNN
jgi:hypothetical protein